MFNKEDTEKRQFTNSKTKEFMVTRTCEADRMQRTVTQIPNNHQRNSEAKT